MLRENFVGTVFKLDTTGWRGWPDGEQPVLITGFLGEGAEAVVFGIAPLDDPTREQHVAKIYKPTPYFQMQTLHHSFSVHTGLYPDHPLAMSAEARLAMLENEMLAKVDDRHMVFGVEFYREIVDATIGILATTFAEATESAPLDQSPARLWLDDNVAYRITELLEEDLVATQFHPPLRRALGEVERAITRWQAAGTYAPASRNPLVTLTGLLFEDFIDNHEYLILGLSPNFAARVTPQHTEKLFQAISVFYFLLRDGAEAEPAEGLTIARVSAAASACDLLRHFGAIVPGRAEHYAALASAWKARFLMLAKEPLDAVEQLLLSALETWHRLGDMAECHDALRSLAVAHWPTNPQATVRYLDAAERICRWSCLAPKKGALPDNISQP